MKYRYKLTWREAAGCGLRLAVQRLAQRFRLVLGIFLVIIGVSALNVTVSATVGGGNVIRDLWAGGALAAGILLLLLLGTWFLQTRQVVRRCSQEERTLTMEDGLLTVSGSREVIRYRCQEMGIVKRRGRVYWIQVCEVTGSRGAVSGESATGGAVSGGPATGGAASGGPVISGAASGGPAISGAASGGTASARSLPGSLRWLFLPARVLGGKEGQAQFFQALEEQRKLPGDIPDSLWIKEPMEGNRVDHPQDATSTVPDTPHQTDTSGKNAYANLSYHSLDPGFCICQERDFPQMLMVTAQWDWIRKQYLTRWKKRRYLYTPAAVGLAILLLLVLGEGLGRGPGRSLGGSGGILLGVAAYYYLRLFRNWQRCKPVPLPLLRRQLLGIWPESGRGKFQLAIDRNGVWRRNLAEEHFWAWNELGWILESENHYFLCTKQETLAVSFDKELLGQWMNRKLFVQDCQNQGLHWEVITPQIIGSVSEIPPRQTGLGGKDSIQSGKGGRDFIQSGKGGRDPVQLGKGGRDFIQSGNVGRNPARMEKRQPKRDVAAVWGRMPREGGEGNGRILFTLCAIAALAAATFLLPEYGGRGGGYGFYPEIQGEDGDHFQPENYVNYLPLDQQVKVLEELGFQVPEEDVEALWKSMEEDDHSRVWIEGYPYRALLSSLGMPKWNEETWEVTGYSDQAFWFDWEAFSLEGTYNDILSSINAMSGGRCQIWDIQIDTAEVDWERGSGRIAIRYQVNGMPQECTVSVQNDWLDPVFLEYVNRGLKAAGVPERLYAMDDGGQGSVLFFRDKTWAKEFEKRTGVELE